MLEDLLAEQSADAAEKRSKEAEGIDHVKSETAGASNKSLSNILICCLHRPIYNRLIHTNMYIIGRKKEQLTTQVHMTGLN